MNFYQAQADARRNTGWLVLLFILAVAGLIAAAVLVVLLALAARGLRHGDRIPTADPALVAPVALGVLLLVALGSLYKMRQLAAGGKVVAESLDGTLLPRSSQDPLHRRVLNVVEEMALAAGLPVPAVYLLDEPGINAFAAGWTPRDAVIGVTQGAAERLTREELQGVIAHEFSHIAGGDMARNLQLTGALHGILLLGIAGYYLLHALRYNRRGNLGLALLILAPGLMLVGFVGTFFGNMIKAVISRQREFLADASAVQFTRNPQGIGDALKKIGGLGAGSRLGSAAAPEFSHCFFANGVKASFSSPLATHPPLAERVRRLDPDWDGRWLLAPAAARTAAEPAAAHPQVRSLGVLGALRSLEDGGLIDTRNLGYARGLLGRLSNELAGGSRQPHDAQALMLALVLDADPAVRGRQLELLHAGALSGASATVEQYAPQVAALAPELRLPLVDLSVASLRELSRPQYLAFRKTLLELMLADQRVDLGEWILQRLLLRQLDGAHNLLRAPGVRKGELGSAREAARLLMATLAWLEHEDDSLAAQAFDVGWAEAGLTGLEIPSRQAPDTVALDAALDLLSALGRPARIALMRGLTACVALDGRLTIEGLEMLRALAGSLELPMPSFVAVEE